MIVKDLGVQQGLPAAGPGALTWDFLVHYTGPVSAGPAHLAQRVTLRDSIMWIHGRKGDAMRSSGASLAVVAALAIGSVSLAGCSKFGEVKAMRAFKEGNTAYQQQDYQHRVA